MKLKKVFILPTGNELASGIVLDTDSPMILQRLLKEEPNCMVTRFPISADESGAIVSRIRQSVEQGADLVILIGGSGSGHLHSEILGKDCTGESMESLLEESTATALYGKNGHMWSRLVCGWIGSSLIVNVPGPFTEAQAACEALCQNLDGSLQQINAAMAEAVRRCYLKYPNY